MCRKRALLQWQCYWSPQGGTFTFITLVIGPSCYRNVTLYVNKVDDGNLVVWRNDKEYEDLVVIGCADVERKGGSYEVRWEGGVRAGTGVWGEEGGCSLRITESGWGTSLGVNTLAGMAKTGQNWGQLSQVWHGEDGETWDGDGKKNLIRLGRGMGMLKMVNCKKSW